MRLLRKYACAPGFAFCEGSWTYPETNVNRFHKEVNSMRRCTIWALAFCVAVLPAMPSFAADGQTRVPVRNVELNSKGQVVGILIDAAKKPLVGKSVAVHTKAGVEKVSTNQKGVFTLTSAKGGPCKIVVDERAYVCRLWSAGTAPPKSLGAIGLVHAPNHLVRGQSFDDCGDECGEGGGRFGTLGGISGGQLLGLGLLGGAVTAIVIAANNDDDAS